MVELGWKILLFWYNYIIKKSFYSKNCRLKEKYIINLILKSDFFFQSICIWTITAWYTVTVYILSRVRSDLNQPKRKKRRREQMHACHFDLLALGKLIEIILQLIFIQNFSNEKSWGKFTCKIYLILKKEERKIKCAVIVQIVTGR